MEKYVNWKSVSTSIFLAIIFGLWGFWKVKAESVWVEYKETVQIAQSYQKEQSQIKQNTILLEKIAQDIQEIKISTSTLVGYARVQPNDESGVVGMLVNKMSTASVYQKYGSARVTNISSPESPSIVIKVDGAFRNADEKQLILISKRAAVMLGVENGEGVKVRLEQVVEEE